MLSPRVATQGTKLPGAAALPCQLPAAARGFFPAPGPAVEQEQQGAGTALPGALPRAAGELALLLRFPRPHTTSTKANGVVQGRGGSTAPCSSSRQHGTARAGLTAPAQRGLLGAPWLPASRLHRPVLPAPGSQGETAGACARPGNAKRSGAQPCTKRCVPAALLAHGAKAGKQHCPVRDLPWPPSSCRRSRGAGTAAPSRPPSTARLWVRGRVSTGGTTGPCTHSPVTTPSRCGGAAAPALHTHTHAAPVTQQGAGAQLRLLLPHNPYRRMGARQRAPTFCAQGREWKLAAQLGTDHLLSW